MLTTEKARWHICRLCTQLDLQAIFQVEELVGWVEKSNANFIILGGDFNTDPKDNETSYHSLKQVMTNSMEEFFLDIKVVFFFKFPCQKHQIEMYIRNGCAPEEPPMATLRTHTATCTPLYCMTTYGTSRMAGTSSGLISLM